MILSISDRGAIPRDHRNREWQLLRADGWAASCLLLKLLTIAHKVYESSPVHDEVVIFRHILSTLDYGKTIHYSLQFH